MLLFAVGFVVTVFAAASVWLLRTGKLNGKSWLASAVVVTWLAGVGIKVHFDADSATDTADLQAIAAIAWPEADTLRQAASSKKSMDAAPIDSLLGGLEQRLADHPDDAKGWGLLAQSYSFMGDNDAAEKALRRAVELGVDEQSLRERVRLAERAPHATGRVEESVGG